MTMHPMSTLRLRAARRLAKWLAWSLVALTVALGLSTVALVVAVTRAAVAPDTPVPPEAIAALQLSGRDWLQTPLVLVEAWGFAVLGAVLVSRQRARALAWLFSVVGVVGAVEYFAGYYALYSLFVVPAALPGRWMAAWFQDWIWPVNLMFLSVLVPLRFPTGRLVSARWRPVWWLALGATAALAFLLAFAPGPLSNVLDGAYVLNPYGISSLANGTTSLLMSVLYVVLPVSVLLTAASLVVRLRRAQGVERQQIKWFAYCTILIALLVIVLWVVSLLQSLLGFSLPITDLGYALYLKIALIGLPLAIGLSILRYHLFDIDVIIRLTLVYGTLTALLAGAYITFVLAAQAVVRGFTGEAGEQQPVIVSSTLLVVALSMPLRRAIQAAIDRRFYRRKVDAERTLAAFSAALRSEVDLERLRELVLAVVDETVQPTHASLWLSPPRRRMDHEQQPIIQWVFHASAPKAH